MLCIRCGLLLLTCGVIRLCVGLHVRHVTTRYLAKTARPIEMPFGMWGGVGHSHHVLDVCPDPPGEEAILG